MAIFKGKLKQSSTGDAVITPLTNGFPNELNTAGLTLVRESVGTYSLTLALSALLNSDNVIAFIQPDSQYTAGTCQLDDIGQLIHRDANGSLSDDFAASVYIETVNQ